MRSKVFLLLLSLFSFIALLSGCAPAVNAPKNDQQLSLPPSGGSIESIPPATLDPVLSVEFVQEKLVLDTKGHWVYFAGEVKNTSGKPVELDDLAIEIENEHGELVKVIEYIDTYPEVIEPHCSAYIYQSVFSKGIDSDIDITAEYKHKIRYQIEPALSSPIPVEITQATLGNKMGFPNLVCKVKNNDTRDYEYLIVAAPLFSAEGELLGIFDTYIDVCAGEEIGFDTMMINADSYLDYSNAVLGEIYIYPSSLT